LRLLRHRHSVIEITGTVVEPGQDVAMEIDGSVNRRIISARIPAA